MAGTPASFEEKTYEFAVNLELTTGGCLPCPVCGDAECPVPRDEGEQIEVWPPGQYLEGRVGFDAVVTGGYHMPAGFNWQRDLIGRHAELAQTGPAVGSLFLQYKRPHLIKARHGSWKDRFDGRYYRFDLDSDQHGRLVDLDVASGDSALVLYVSARFHLPADFESARRDRALWARSARIPAGADKAHQHGAYDGALQGLFSEPEWSEPPAVEEWLRALGGGSVGDDGEDSVAVHIVELARRLDDPSAQAPDGEGDVLSAALAIHQRANQLGLVWLLALHFGD